MKKVSIRKTALSVVGFSIIALLSILLDSWFYGEWVFAPWNYFKENVIVGKASGFGTQPWYYYFFLVFRQSFFPIGSILILTFIGSVYSKARHLTTWILLAFVLIHSIIPHKELRFLFPIMDLTPLMLIMVAQDLKIFERWNQSLLVKAVMSLLILTNICALTVASLKPAGEGRIAIAHKLNDLIEDEPRKIVFSEGSNPFDPWGGLNAEFYDIYEQRFTKLADVDNLATTEPHYLLLKQKDLRDPTIVEFLSERGYKNIAQGYPDWILSAMKVYGSSYKDVPVLYSN